MSGLSRRSGLRIFGAAMAVIIAVSAGLPARADDGSDNPLRKQALELYPADDISTPDAAGNYEIPKGAASPQARQARRLLEQAAAAGDDESHKLLGFMLEVGAGGPRDYAAARKQYAQSDDRIALWHLGLMLIDGKGGTRDLPRARALFKQAADKGLVDARYEYARMAELGLGGPKYPAQARRNYEDTLEWYHGDVANRYSMLLERGIGGPVDHRRAAEMQIKAVSCHNHYFEMPVILATPKLLSSETIRQVQILLKADDGYDGPVTGRVDAATRKVLGGKL